MNSLNMGLSNNIFFGPQLPDTLQLYDNLQLRTLADAKEHWVRRIGGVGQFLAELTELRDFEQRLAREFPQYRGSTQ